MFSKKRAEVTASSAELSPREVGGVAESGTAAGTGQRKAGSREVVSGTGRRERVQSRWREAEQAEE